MGSPNGLSKVEFHLKLTKCVFLYVKWSRFGCFELSYSSREMRSKSGLAWARFGHSLNFRKFWIYAETGNFGREFGTMSTQNLVGCFWPEIRRSKNSESTDPPPILASEQNRVLYL